MDEKLLNKYKIIEINDTGGFGTIYKVVDDKNNIFAFKKLSGSLNDEKLNR